MRSLFSKLFFPVALIMLAALLAIGLFFQLQVREVMQEQTLDRLENNAHAVAELANTYYSNEGATDNFLLNISMSYRVTEMSSVICDLNGRLILCAENPLSCPHQGLVISDDFVSRVVENKVVRSTGVIQGLYKESRNVVAVPIENDGKAIGIVITSVPVSEEMLAFNRLSEARGDFGTVFDKFYIGHFANAGFYLSVGIYKFM